jgi:hypothetical protein
MPFGNAAPPPFTDKILRKFTGKGPRYDFLAARSRLSRQFDEFDFCVKALDTTNQWTATNSSTSTQWAVLAQAGGWIRGVTGASVATGALQLSIPQKYWDGTRGAGMATLIQLSDVTEVRLEQGFADVLPAIGTTVVNSLASATFNSVTTGAVYVYDHVSGTGATTGLYCIGSSTTGNKVATTTQRYDSAATLFVAIEVYNRNAYCWIGSPTAAPVLVAAATPATNAANSWLPFINVKTNTGSKNVDLDCFWTWSVGRM